MTTRVALDNNLILEAMELGGHNTKRAAVAAALDNYVKSMQRKGILELIGKVDFDRAYDYKAARRRGNKRIPTR